MATFARVQPGEGSGDLVLFAWNEAPDAAGLATRLASELLGRHPGPLHRSCPTCGGIEHGRPYFDAPVEVSIGHATPVTVVVVSNSFRVGVDLELQGAADREWVEAEALAKAHGVGVAGRATTQRLSEAVTFVDLAIPGYLAVLAIAADSAPEVREWREVEGVRVSSTRH